MKVLQSQNCSPLCHHPRKGKKKKKKNHSHLSPEEPARPRGDARRRPALPGPPARTRHAPRERAGPRGTAPGAGPGAARRSLPSPRSAPASWWAASPGPRSPPLGAAAARPRLGAPLTEAARGAPSGSPPGTRCCSPPAASLRRDLGDGAAATATPAGERDKAAAAEPSPPRARSRPHLPPPPPPPPPRRLAPRPAAPARGSLAATRRALGRSWPRPACQSPSGRRPSRTPHRPRGPARPP